MRVKCLNNNKIFQSMVEAADWAEVSSIDIVRQIKGKRCCAGYHPVTGKALEWSLLYGSVDMCGSIPTKCLNNGKIFASQTEASAWARTTQLDIRDQIKGEVEYAGHDPETGQPLKWERLSDNIFTEPALVRCVETGKTFPSEKEAAKWAETFPSLIKYNIKHVLDTAGNDPKTGKPLKWEYVDEKENETTYSLDTTETIPTKICTKCGKELPATEEYFYKDKTHKDNLKAWCKECVKEHSREYNSKKVDDIIKQNTQIEFKNNKKDVVEKRCCYDGCLTAPVRYYKGQWLCYEHYFKELLKDLGPLVLNEMSQGKFNNNCYLWMAYGAIMSDLCLEELPNKINEYDKLPGSGILNFIVELENINNTLETCKEEIVN